jgi:hypothetical protein
MNVTGDGSATSGSIEGHIPKARLHRDKAQLPPEYVYDFGFLWFEDEYVIDVASRWVLAANAADELVKQAQTPCP